MTVVQRKAMLKAEGFFPHKKNGKGTSIIYSRKHPSAKFVRVVVDSGIDGKTGKIVGKVGVKLCYINRQKQWREITTEVFTTNTGLVKTIKAQEAAEKFVKTKWGGKKKSATTQKKKPQKSSQKIAAQKTKAARQKNLQRKPQRKSAQKFAAKILPGDLVTVEQMIEGKLVNDYTGSILGVVMTVEPGGYVKANWTANTSSVADYDLPYNNKYSDRLHTVYRFKVLSRPVEYALVS
jgi:hypothetical protein